VFVHKTQTFCLCRHKHLCGDTICATWLAPNCLRTTCTKANCTHHKHTNTHKHLFSLIFFLLIISTISRGMARTRVAVSARRGGGNRGPIFTDYEQGFVREQEQRHAVSAAQVQCPCWDNAPYWRCSHSSSCAVGKGHSVGH